MSRIHSQALRLNPKRSLFFDLRQRIFFTLMILIFGAPLSFASNMNDEDDLIYTYFVEPTGFRGLESPNAERRGGNPYSNPRNSPSEEDGFPSLGDSGSTGNHTVEFKEGEPDSSWNSYRTVLSSSGNQKSEEKNEVKLSPVFQGQLSKEFFTSYRDTPYYNNIIWPIFGGRKLDRWAVEYLDEVKEDDWNARAHQFRYIKKPVLTEDHHLNSAFILDNISPLLQGIIQQKFHGEIGFKDGVNLAKLGGTSFANQPNSAAIWKLFKLEERTQFSIMRIGNQQNHLNPTWVAFHISDPGLRRALWRRYESKDLSDADFQVLLIYQQASGIRIKIKHLVDQENGTLNRTFLSTHIRNSIADIIRSSHGEKVLSPAEKIKLINMAKKSFSAQSLEDFYSPYPRIT